MTSTSKAMHIHISTGQMYNTENHDKSAISCKVSTTLLRSTAWPCWWCMLCYIKTNNTAAIYAAALLAAGGHGVFVQSWAELWLLLLSALWTCCQLLLATTSTLHRAEQSKYYRMDTEYSSLPPLLSVAQYKAQELEMSCYTSLMLEDCPV